MQRDVLAEQSIRRRALTSQQAVVLELPAVDADHGGRVTGIRTVREAKDSGTCQVGLQLRY